MVVRVLLIDPKLKKVSVDYISSHPDRQDKDFCTMLGCTITEIVRLAPGLCLVIDEEGFLKPNYHFVVEGYNDKHPFAGKAAVVQRDDKDEFVSALADPEFLLKCLDFIGDDLALEKRFVSGHLIRPQSTFTAGNNPPEVFWSWKPHIKNDTPPPPDKPTASVKS